MCGILGEMSFKKLQTTSKIEFEKLLKLSKKRGPDHSCVYRDSYCQLGFNRLAILDLSEAANQPIESPSGKYHLVFNGEIYNYQELQEEYQLESLRSSSDTEVVLQLFDKVGVDKTIGLLNGMFAIAVIDKEADILTLARDFAGIKPLFYGIKKTGVVFASQFDQVFKHEWFIKEISLRPEIMKEYFGFGYMQAPNTVYKDIFQVEPGEKIEFKRNGEVYKEFFYRLPKNPIAQLKENQSTAESFINEFQETIRRQLRSDLPVGSFLSGGIDSPLVSSCAKSQYKNISVYTLKVEDLKLDESEIAIKYAKHIRVNQKIVSISEGDLLKNIDKHFKGFPEPFGDYSSIPTYLVTKKAKEIYTVMLSGDGGDELFWGYPRMLDIIQKHKWFRIPFRFRKILNIITNKLNFTNTHAPYYFKTLEEFILNKQLKIGNDHLREIFPKIEFSPEMVNLYSGFTANNKVKLLQEIKWNEFYAHMQRILIKVDRTSMQNSMEVRVPFLDKRIIEFSNTIIPGLGIAHEVPKKVLKEALGTFVPTELIDFKKRGFSVPVENWFRKELRDDLIKTVFETPIYGAENIDVFALRNYVQRFLNGEIVSGWGVWHIYSWQKWAKNHTI